jgi:hypothetical protein
VHSGSVALGGPQTNSSSLQGGLLSAKATPEPNTYRSNLHSRRSHELGPIGLTMQARVNPRPLLGILAERTGLIAKKGPPRLCWPSAWCWQVTRYGGLGDAEPEHEKFTMDPHWRPSDAASDHVIDISKSLTIRYDVSARRFPAERSPGFRAIAATRTTARSKAADPYAANTGDEFGCAPVRQFDGAARSIPTAAQCGFGVRFGRPGLLRLSAPP